MEDLTENQKISLCGSVDLLATVFNEDREKLRARYGLPSPYRYCLHCGKRLRGDKQLKLGFCSRKCKDQYAHIQVACSECGKLFDRVQGVLMAASKRGYEHTFCNRSCLGKFAGRNYGFAAHPENIRYSDRND